MRVGIVGAGRKGHQHMGILAEFPDVVLTALCDPIEMAREEKGTEFGIEHRYADVPTFLEGEAEVETQNSNGGRQSGSRPLRRRLSSRGSSAARNAVSPMYWPPPWIGKPM